MKTMQLQKSHYQEGQTKTIRANRTGAATAIGGVGLVDSGQTDPASTTIEDGLDNVVGVTTALIDKVPLLVVAAEVIADDARGQFIEGECVRCRVLVESTVAVAKGDKLKPVNGTDHLVKATVQGDVAEGGTATHTMDRWYAEALDAKAGAGEGLLEVLLYSRGRF